MDGELLEKAESIFGGVFPIRRRPARLKNSSAEKFRCPPGEDVDARRRAGSRPTWRIAANVARLAVRTLDRLSSLLRLWSVTVSEQPGIQPSVSWIAFTSLRTTPLL
jgi:hypothetical protein